MFTSLAYNVRNHCQPNSIRLRSHGHEYGVYAENAGLENDGLEFAELEI